MDFLQKMRRSHSMESKARKPTANSHKESLLPNQTPYEYYKIKYETKYHPLLKKSKLLGFKVTKFFKLSNGSFLYANQKNAKKPLKTIPLKLITCFEVRPFAMGFDFCVEIHPDKGSACWAHCHTEHEKNFLIDYLSQNQTHHNRGSNFQSIQGPVQPGNNVNNIDPPTSALEDIGFLNTEENIAVEVIPNQGQWTVEKRIQKYQRKTIRIGAKTGDVYLSQSFYTVPKDVSFDDSGSADGIDNKVPVLPQAKQIEKLYEYQESQSCLPLGERPSPRLNMDSPPLGIAKANNTEYLVTEMCPPPRLRSAREGVELTEEEAEGMNAIQRLKAPNLLNSHRNHRESVMTMKMSLPRQNSDLFNKQQQSFTSNSPTHAKETCSTRDAKRSSKELEVHEEEEIEEEGIFDIGKVKTLEDCVEMGCKLMWQNELDKARECLKLYKDKSYLVQLLDCECDLQEVCVSGLEVKVRQALNKLIDLSARISNENSHFSKEDPNKHFEMELNKAEIYLAECILYCFLGNRFNAVKRVTDAWRAYRRVENLTKKKDILSKLSKLNQHRYKFGQGCFSVAFSLFSSVLLKIGKLIGIKSDRAEGLRLLEECRQEQSIRSHYAALFLAVYKLEILALFEDASLIVTESLRESKGNSLFYWIGSLVCWKYTKIQDSYFMIKTALMRLGDRAKNATYFKFELGLHYFLENEWEMALEIFKGIAAQSFPKKFFISQVTEVQAIAKNTKIALPVDLSDIEENFEETPPEEICILPCPVQLSMKIACCYFNLNKPNLGMKWLLTIIILHKKHTGGMPSKTEEEFYHLALKYLNRTSMRLLTYETSYFMKHFPRLPDEKLQIILADLNKYRQQLIDGLLDGNDKENSLLIEFASSTLIVIVSNCLMGETELACAIYESSKPILYKPPSDQLVYILHHIEYWVGRALIEDRRLDEAREILKASLKKKKCTLNIAHKVKQVLAGIELDE